ncbi:protein-glutamate O-methyltransferase CheR [Persephonella sp. IF05-L8]|uniref:CheR family methyltransferase n=1 Tax=Persephonella sp. IF05-L8 TaxID=1158338 RepID=UPI0004972BD5
MDVSSQQLKKLRDFIQINTGIFIDDDKLNSIYKRKIKELITKNNYKDFDAFYRDVLRNQSLRQELYNAVTVNETYFFREEYQFKTLVKYIIPELDKIRPPTEPINILSAPCSTGEEVYSIAIYIMEEGHYIKKRDFMLLGIDIDSEAIRKAKEGIYSERSVSKLPQHIKEKYFKKIGNQYQVIDQLRKAVSFKVVNVMDKHTMKRLGKFDVIFSRNMLIYFNEIHRREILSTFYNMLKPAGYLFLGHAERIPPSLKLFKQIKLGESFVYKKE